MQRGFSGTGVIKLDGGPFTEGKGLEKSQVYFVF